MAGGISINILADVRDAVRGADNVADAMEQVADVLHDIANDSDDTTDRMEQDFRDLSRTADQEADDLKQKFRQAYRDVKGYSDDTRDVAVKNTRKMGAQSAEVGQEIRQNLGEGIANAARGDFEALGDTIGDTFGGAVAGIGGVAFAAVAAAGALGIGAITAAFREAEEQRKKLEDRANDLAKAYIDAGSEVLDAITLASRTSEIITNTETRKEAEEFAKVIGVDLPTAARILAGDTNALSIQQQILADKLKEIEDIKRSASDNPSVTATDILAIQDQSAGLDEVGRKLAEVAENNSLAAKTAREQSDALLGIIDDAKGATVQVDKLNNKLITLPKGEQIVIDAETGRATLNIDKFKGDVNKIPKKKAVTVEGTVDLSAVTRGIRNYKAPTVTVFANVKTISNKYGSRQLG